MNWLIYIGGFIPFFIVFAVIVNSFGFNKVINNDNITSNIVTLIGYIISPLLIWIWICWKFI